ncbi:MAG: 2OG-Fe dioxygenase family protein, partial [Burkholderiaceae bacterium]|nr:2OG-Fe dioxygenase family protein [Burkholderiaceae bacterium]
MAPITFLPPFIPAADVARQLCDQGHAVLAPHDVAHWMGCELSDLMALNSDWEALPPDEFLKDGGRYRRRRHACFQVQAGQVKQVPPRAHWQPLEYNALHGGMERW